MVLGLFFRFFLLIAVPLQRDYILLRSFMKRKIPFTKMHGAGNDYIYVNTILYDVPHPEEAAIAWSDRHTGIGSDGLVLIGKSPIPEADFSMRIFNADGSEAMMCGNASRCIGKYLYERAQTTQTQIRLLTKSGIKTLSLHVKAASKREQNDACINSAEREQARPKVNNGVVESVTVDMGEPLLENPEQFVPTRGLDGGTFVSMGNPHYVIFTDNIDQVGETGRMLEHHPAFPQRCNIEFASVEARKGLFRTRVWERGSGITQACGTGACATAVAACITARAGRRSTIVMDGGTLDIEWRETDNHVYMTGPAAFVFDGEIECI